MVSQFVSQCFPGCGTRLFGVVVGGTGVVSCSDPHMFPCKRESGFLVLLGQHVGKRVT